MVRNRCLNHLKNYRINSEIISLDELSVSELQYLYQLDLNGRKEKSLEEMLIASLQNAVNELPPKMKEVFVSCKII
jgi:DNA-directed RNA polymerase specialized sigma24 family protein